MLRFCFEAEERGRDTVRVTFFGVVALLLL